MPRGQGQLQRDLDVFAREDETTRNEITRRAKALYAHARAEVNQGAAELPKLFPSPRIELLARSGPCTGGEGTAHRCKQKCEQFALRAWHGWSGAVSGFHRESRCPDLVLGQNQGPV